MGSGKLMGLIVIKDSSIVSLAIISIPFLLLDQVSIPVYVFQGLFWLKLCLICYEKIASWIIIIVHDGSFKENGRFLQIQLVVILSMVDFKVS